MAEAHNTEKVKKELEELVKSISSKVDSYIQVLKLKSSDEILSGSIQAAQKLLNQIAPIEEGYKELSESHDKFFEVLNGDYTAVESEITVAESEVTVDKSEATVDKSEATVDKSEATVDKSEAKAAKTAAKSENAKDGDYTADKIYRVPILKALIYLGGSAKLDEVAEFIKKEMKNKFKPADLVKGNNGFDKLWIESIHIQKEKMVKEGLVLEDKNDKVWEIVQQGIDYLAKFSK